MSDSPALPAPHAPNPDRTIREATTADLPAIGRILGASFRDDPSLAYWMRQDEKQLEASERLFYEMAKRIYLPKGLNFISEAETAVALWLPPPGHHKTGVWELITSLPFLGFVSGWKGLRRAGQVVALMDSKHPSEPHYYLFAIGVHPSLQGRGLGTAILKPGCDAADAAGMPAYLESSKEMNVPLYERFGFRVVEHLTVPGTNVNYWLMWREPQ